MIPCRTALLAGAAAALVGLARFAARSAAPGDYDAIGFVLALNDFDLDRFQPHFPGYPVYVALGKAAHAVISSPLAAATAVSAIAAALTAAAIFHFLHESRSPRAAWIGLGLYAAAALPFLTGAAALSDGTAASLATLAFAALAAHYPFVAGLSIALMLGARASYFPLALSWALCAWRWRRPGAARAVGGALIGTGAWAVPFVTAVGARHLVELGRIHLRGHFADWGGSVATRPDPALRFAAFARDLFFDGLAPHAWALAVLAAIVVFSARRVRLSRGEVLPALVVFVPYALWALLGQNIVEQPRHALPLVLILIVALACALEARPLFGGLAILVTAAASLPLALAHHRTIAAGAQLAAHVAASYPARDVAIFGGRSIRFVRTTAPRVTARERAWLSEVDVDLERLDRLPAHILVTSEVEADPRRARRLVAGPIFCRDARLDRRQPCVQLFEYAITGGSAP